MNPVIKRLSVGALSLSAAGLLAICGYEGFSDTVYIPVPGDGPTAGFGHKDSRLRVGEIVTSAQALAWLGSDVKTAEEAVRRCVRVPLYQHEFDAYVSFAFNVGGGAFCSSTLVKKLNAGDYAGACGELKRWIYSGGVKYGGLEARRKMETMTCVQGVYPQK